MKITIRLIVSLLFVMAMVVVFFSFYQVRNERIRLTKELDRRAIVLAESLQESVIPLVQANSLHRLNRLVQRFGNRERLRGFVVLDREGNIIASTSELRSRIAQPLPQAVSALAENRPVDGFLTIDGKKTYLFALPLSADDGPIGSLALFYDASYIDVRLEGIWTDTLLRFLIMALFIAVITLLTVKWSITGPIANFAEWMRELRTGKSRAVQPASSLRGDVLAPLVSEAAQLAKSLAVARARAEEEARLRVQGESLWTAHGLKEHMNAELGSKKLFLISNREPYMHIKDGRTVRCIAPAGGLVTALDPVMRTCDGVWIAHGGGEADREAADAAGKLRVPPEDPSYTLKRVWLTKEEEEGYYYGFSNEGLWPLCHITHTRPIFRLEDWVYYQRVNEKFAEALLAEIAGEESPLVMIQDYQLALLPLLVKEKRPDAKVALFWHIPWPNPEAYGICPWHQEILLGMLGADIIGFHIQFHCNNFLDTVDRFLESKIDWEQFSVNRGGHRTLVKPFPISVRFEDTSGQTFTSAERAALREDILREKDLHAEFLGVGVDRIDYTKGIVERFRAIERFFEKYPEFVGKFTFAELGAPSRTHIKRYRELAAEVEETVDSINWKLQGKGWKPIVFLKAHHSHDEINRYYRASDVCMVTSLHDGMNLVAKEFVATRSDDDGALILSKFAGASRELRDAVIVNPYDVEEMADAIYLALNMDPLERADRMKRMRGMLREHNIYRWAGNLITTLARLRSSDVANEKKAQP